MIFSIICVIMTVIFILSLFCLYFYIVGLKVLRSKEENKNSELLAENLRLEDLLNELNKEIEELK